MGCIYTISVTTDKRSGNPSAESHILLFHYKAMKIVKEMS